MSYNVLIVDDSQTMRSIVKKIVLMSKIDVGNFYEADSGKTGLEMIKSNNINLVLLDINMPVMDGIEMVKYLKNNKEFDHIPIIIIITTEGTNKRLEEANDLGVQGFIRKPFNPKDIKDILDSLEAKNGNN